MKSTITALLLIASLANGQEIRRNPTVENYRQQISSINLVNGLYLTPVQVENTLKVLRELKDVEAEYQQKFDELIPAMQAEYAKLFQEVTDNKGISKPVEQSAGVVQKKERALKEEYGSKLVELEGKLTGILTENQLCIVDEFKPCLVPPKSLRDPARVGQAKGDATSAINTLERIRKVPPKKYLAARERAIEEYLDNYEKKIELLGDDHRKSETQRVGEVLDLARSLSAVDFEMKKELLGKQILIEPDYKKKKNELGKIGKILLDIRLIPILEQRLVASN